MSTHFGQDVEYILVYNSPSPFCKEGKTITIKLSTHSTKPVILNSSRKFATNTTPRVIPKAFPDFLRGKKPFP